MTPYLATRAVVRVVVLTILVLAAFLGPHLIEAAINA